MSANTFDAVPRLAGDNYKVWAREMKSYLMHIGVWDIVENGPPTEPTVPAGGTLDFNQQLQLAKFNADILSSTQKAFGTIQCKINTAIASQYQSHTTAKGLWDALKAAYDVTSPSQLLIDFKWCAKFRLPEGKNPAPAIATLAERFERLKDNQVNIPETLRALMLASSLPDSWDHASASIFQLHADLGHFTWDAVKDDITREYSRLYGMDSNGKRNSEFAARISGVKQKGKNPRWQNQKGKAKEDPKASSSNSSSTPSQDSSKEKKNDGGKGKTQRGKGRGRRGKQHAASSSHISDVESDDENQHVHMVSAAYVPEPLPPAAKALQARMSDPPAQRFTGLNPGPSVWTKNNEVRDLASRIGARPSSSYLNRLDTVVPDIDLSPPPRKRQRSDSEDEDSDRWMGPAPCLLDSDDDDMEEVFGEYQNCNTLA
jgi:hypothetical protein